MAKKKSLIDHPDYPLIVERYAYNIVRFTTELFGYIPTPDQRLLYGKTAQLNARVSISSGHGTGKTFSFALIALWHLICYPLSNTFITAPKIDTVKDGIWKEFTDHLEKLRANGYSWIADAIVVMHKKVYVQGYALNHFIIPKTAPKGSPANIAGTHRESLLWIADEACGIPDENFGVIGGSLTEGDRNRFIIASQPLKSSGFFYDTHHTLSKDNGGVWDSLVFNSEESPRVSDSFIKEKILQYGGRDTQEYSIKVLGEFPETLDGMMLGRKEIQACFRDSCIKDDEEYGFLLSSDVGGGGFRDSSVLIVAKVTGYGDVGVDARRLHIESIPLHTNSINEVEFTGEVFNHIVEAGLLNATYLIDMGGGGATVMHLLENKGVPSIESVIWGKPCFSKENIERYMNQRAQCNASCARAIKEGRVTFSVDNIPQTIATEIKNQGSRIPYFWNEKQKLQMVSKADMRRDGIPSPDLWDAICHFFLEDAYYSVSHGARKADKDTIIAKANSFLEELN